MVRKGELHTFGAGVVQGQARHSPRRSSAELAQRVRRPDRREDAPQGARVEYERAFDADGDAGGSWGIPGGLNLCSSSSSFFSVTLVFENVWAAFGLAVANCLKFRYSELSKIG